MQNKKNIKFNLTPNMSLELINFNKLKEEYLVLTKEYEKTNDELVLIKIVKKEKEMNDCKTRFIEEFRMGNQKEIEKYLNTKN